MPNWRILKVRTIITINSRFLYRIPSTVLVVILTLAMVGGIHSQSVANNPKTKTQGKNSDSIDKSSESKAKTSTTPNQGDDKNSGNNSGNQKLDEKEAKNQSALSRKTDILKKVLKYGTSLERKAGLAEIEKLPEEFQTELKPLILESLKKEKESTMRLAFIRVIGNLKIEGGVEEIYKAIGDENEDLARQAVFSLKKIDPENGWEKVLARLKTEDLTKNSNLTVSLIEALGELKGGESAKDFMDSKLKESFNSPEIRAQIALYMGKKKIKESETTLQKIAFNDKEILTLRTYSINSLGKIDSKTSIPKLRELIDEIRNKPAGRDTRRNQLLKVYSLGALVDLGADGVFEEIVEFTRDDDSIVRLRALKFLAETKKEEAKEILEYKSLRDPSPTIQKFSKQALEDWDKPSEDSQNQNNAKSEDDPETDPSKKPTGSKGSESDSTEEDLDETKVR